MTNHHKITSSASIEHIDYDDATDTLEIKFASGGTYRYDDCPKDHHHGLKNADSAGKYFHANIRNKYTSTRIDN